MDHFYAQLDENNICIGISQLSGEVNKPNMISITEDGYSVDKILRKYENGVWGDRMDIAQGS